MYAHFRESDKTFEPLFKHLENTADICGKCLEVIGWEKIGILVGLIHDVGKSNPQWQARLADAATSKQKIGIHHAPASAACLSEIIKNIYGKSQTFYTNILWHVTANHHSKLKKLFPDEHGVDKDIADELQSRIQILFPDFENLKNELKKHITKDENHIYNTLFIRFLAGCLVYADHKASESFERNVPFVRNFITSEQALSILNNCKKRQKNNNPINSARTEIQKKCIECGKSSGNLFLLFAPTGSGKTISSLAFAAQNALTFGKSRIIYVAPYLSIIDQTAKDYRSDIVSFPIEECHSNATMEKDGEYGSRKEHKYFDGSVVVTTFNGFFETLFGIKSTILARFANIANSVIIIDEIQKIPICYQKPIAQSIQFLAHELHCTVLLSSATIQNEFFKNSNLILDTDEYTRYASGIFMRNTINKEILHFETIESVARHIEKTPKSVLCVVNNRKTAYLLTQRLAATNDSVFCLTKNIAKIHRAKTLENIKSFDKTNKKCILVSTSLIEAGVDISFPYVMREFIDIISINQTAGRCNRSAEYSEGVVDVFDIGEANYPSYAKDECFFTETILAQYPDFELGDLRLIEKYWNRLDVLDKDSKKFSIGDSDGDYYKELKLIDDKEPYTVVCTIHDGSLADWGVEIYKPQFEVLKKWLKPYGDSELEWQIATDSIYDSMLGLAITVDDDLKRRNDEADCEENCTYEG